MANPVAQIETSRPTRRDRRTAPRSRGRTAPVPRTQVGDGVQRALVSSPHQSRSWTHQIYLHPLAHPLLWNHGFPFLPRQLNFQHSTLTVTLGTLYFPMNSRGSIRGETSSRTSGRSGSWGNLILLSPCAQPVLTFACNAAVITIGKEG